MASLTAQSAAMIAMMAAVTIASKRIFAAIT